MLDQLKLVLSAIDILSFEQPADCHCAEIRSFLEQNGIPIDANDLLIAAHAKCNGLAVVTANFSEFNRVPGLVVENWLKE